MAQKDDPKLVYNFAVTLEKSGKLDEALEQYRKALSLKPDYIEAHFKIGNLLKAQGNLVEAVQTYLHLINIDATHAAVYYNLGLALKALDEADEAVIVYQKAISLNPQMAEAYNNLGVIFNDQRKIPEAENMYRQAISLKPDYAEAHHNLADVLDYQDRQEEAIRHYIEALSHKPTLAESHINLGNVLKKIGLVDEAIARYEHALTLQPDNADTLTRLVDAFYHACAWEKLSGYEARLLGMVRQKRAGISPFTVLETAATAEDQLTCATAFHLNKEKPAPFTHAPKEPGKRIKIGYLSSDLQEHATAYLMAELFERHDRTRFDITAYSCGADDHSAMRRRLVNAFETFVDLHGVSDADAAKKIYDDGIDILIDLKGGATKDAHIDIPSYRPAPIQVNYLGYPGTMGVSFIDYIIADRFIIPADQEKFYSEKVVCLPDCYQPNDTHRFISPTTPTRDDCGLPGQGFVFCSFNASYKITPQVFGIWMRLLQKIPDSVLWLLETNHSVKKNLLNEATHDGINPERIIFAARTSLPIHLARHRLADLFLDTLPINAHTTASDALWSGLPILTCAGAAFAGRVAGSLLKAAELPELITYSLDEYEALALQLAQNRAQLNVIREKLHRTRSQVPLFDIEKFVKNIEKSFQTMFDIRQAGESPKPFTVV